MGKLKKVSATILATSLLAVGSTEVMKLPVASADAQILNFVTTGNTYDAPTQFKSEITSESSLLLSWSYLDAPEYKVTRDGEVIQTIQNSGQETPSFEDTGLTLGNTYTYQVYATNGVELGAAATLEVTFAPLAKPTINTLDPESNPNRFSWEPIPGATGYNIFRDGFYVGTKLPDEKLIWHEAGIEPDKTYTYSVVALNGVLESEPATVQLTTTLERIEQPANTIATVIGENSIKVSWDQVPYATSYKLYLTGSAANYFESQVISDHEYIFTNLRKGTTYTIAVEAKRGDLTSTVSRVVATTEGALIPLPTNLQWQANDQVGVDLSWDAVEGASGYKVYRDTDYVKTVTSPSFHDWGLRSNWTYGYEVSAIQGDIEGPRSNIVAITKLMDEIPIPIPSLKVTGKTYSSVSLSWTEVDGATNYGVYSGGDHSDIIPKNAKLVYYGHDLEAIDTGLIANTEYDYYVYAYKGGSRSEPAKLKVVTAPVEVVIIPEPTPDSGSNGGGAGGSSSGSNASPSGTGVTTPTTITPPDTSSTSTETETETNQQPTLIEPLPMQFKDLSRDHFANVSINRLVSDGTIKGYKDGSFKPNQKVTRAEFISLLVRALKLENTESYKTTFTDVHSSAWYINELSIALQIGLIKGYSDNTIKPSEGMSREQVASMVADILVKAGKVGKPADLTKFKDELSSSTWAKEGLAIAVSSGIMSGYKDGTLRPKQTVTRAETAVIITRLLDAL
ncbi:MULTISPECIES: S-layer homology domain-containing protein [unclassified Paenibacillus]|uniref:S-layer homology domain-containing protein n=1 Tax=unclassified Paenibacillus TaxID=185978 RepID=UPI0003FE8925|nr:MULTISPECIES: S-layer homology domain-containing protein [unclassified Paenibacillus]KGP81382.1 hypothetical protein P363_0128240 [Paenibacillus sp. MAEPY1]KGP82018.1 hypothetical protein P364_0114495 [Paenibacillus sp. MAEPY2]